MSVSETVVSVMAGTEQGSKLEGPSCWPLSATWRGAWVGTGPGWGLGLGQALLSLATVVPFETRCQMSHSRTRRGGDTVSGPRLQKTMPTPFEKE